MVRLEDLSTNHLLNLIKESEKEIEDLQYGIIGFQSVLDKRED